MSNRIEKMSYEMIFKKLKFLFDPKTVAGMATVLAVSISAKWIASDAIRELTSEKIQSRLRVKNVEN